jgi:hypothetical protein
MIGTDNMRADSVPLLQGGDVLSYSAGSTQRGPTGFRHLRVAGVPRPFDLLTPIAVRWPSLIELLNGRPPIVINCYPASLGEFGFAVYVDTYLSERTSSRALQLAEREGIVPVVLGQPLFVAHMLREHVRTGLAIGPHVIVGCGGYTMPQSLEIAMRDWLSASGCELHVVQFYGAAELDAACLIGRERATDGRVRYFSRGDEIRCSEVDGNLWLHRRSEDGADSSSDGWIGFDTGDPVEIYGDEVVLLPSPRYGATVAAQLESWDTDAWDRRTGYLDTPSGAIQLRVDCSVLHPGEIDYFEFCARHRTSWLTKPAWRDPT